MADENPLGDEKSLDISRQLLVTAQEIRNILEQMSGLTATVANNTQTINEAAEELVSNDEKRAEALALQAKQLNEQNSLLTDLSKGQINIESSAKSLLGTRAQETVQLFKQNQLFQAVVGALFKSSELTNEFQQSLGIGYTNSLLLRNELVNAAGASNDIFINSQNLQKSFFALQKTTGVFFDLSSKSAETFTNLTDRIGLAGEEAGNLTTLLRLQGPDTETTMSNLVGTANAALKTSNAAVSVRQILSDVSNTSKGLQASLAANPGALAKAAVAARELGTSLKTLETVQGSLLNFEQSISAELEAELLTGKQLNLEKARTAALNNDLETVGKELMNQGVDLASFGNMNAIQQEKIAEAMGLSRDTLGEMLLRQQTQNMTAEEVKKRFGEQTYEQFKALSAQDKFNAATAKLKDLFVGVMTAFTPIIDLVAMIVKPIAFIAEKLAQLNKLTGGFSNALIGALIIARSLKGGFAPKIMEPLIGKTKELAKSLLGVKDAASNIVFDERMAGGGRFRDLTTGRMVSEETAAAAGVFKPGTDMATEAAEGIAEVPEAPDTGKNLKEKMQNIAEGIKSFADGSVLKGALNMIVASPGIIALGLASVPLKITESINGKKIQTALSGIANGVGAFSKASKGVLGLLGASAAFALLTIGIPGMAAVALLGELTAAGLVALSAGLLELGAAAATGVPFLAVALLGALTLSLVPFGVAVALAGAGIMMVGQGIAMVIEAIADAVVTVVPALTQGLIDLATKVPIPNLFALAFSLPFLGFGLASFGAALLISSAGLLVGSVTLPLISSALSQLGEAISNIDTASFLQFSIGMGILSASLVALGALAPFVLLGTVALYTLSPALLQLGVSLNQIPTDKLIPLASGLLALGGSLALIGLVSPLALVGTFVIGAFSLALLPLAAAGEGLNQSADAIVKIAQAIQLLDIGKVAALAIAVVGLTASIVGLMALGPIGLGALALIGGIGAVGVTAAAEGGEGAQPEGGVAIAEGGEAAGEDIRAMIEETVTATINALVPPMVAALREGQGNVRVVNDNFANSGQGGDINTVRRLPSENIA